LKDFANFTDAGYEFTTINGGNPYGSLIQASDGKLYGMASLGGINSRGVIFSYEPSSSNYTKVVEFDSTNGSNPYGSLIQALDGKLYGMTYGGGNKDAGVIFSYDPSSSAYTKLYDFDFTNGSHPYGNLVQASDKKLYGMTSDGGSIDYGVIFSFDPVTLTYTKLQDYDYSNGAMPYFGSGFVDLSAGITTPVPTISSLQELKIIPNPNNGQFSVRIKLNTIKEVAFTLSNLTGQTIYQSPRYYFSGIQTKQFNEIRLASGLYLLHTKIGSEYFVQKIVVSR